VAENKKTLTHSIPYSSGQKYSNKGSLCENIVVAENKKTSHAQHPIFFGAKVQRKGGFCENPVVYKKEKTDKEKTSKEKNYIKHPFSKCNNLSIFRVDFNLLKVYNTIGKTNLIM